MGSRKMIDAILEYGILKIIYEHDWKQIKMKNTGEVNGTCSVDSYR